MFRFTVHNTKKHKPAILCMWVLLGAILTGCSSTTVKTTTFTPIDHPPEPIAEEELLDVGVMVFDPGLDDLSRREAELTFADVRRAETYFTSNIMANTLQTSGNWGMVRVMPVGATEMDVTVEGTILQSDGETMIVEVEVSDSTGREWFVREYEEVVSKYSYDPRLRRTEDAFQGLYNKVANDMLSWRMENLNAEEVHEIRTVSEIRFARSFAPEAFGSYLSEDRDGNIEIERLPAPNDPLLNRVYQIRERDYQFIDTLQEHYTEFSRQMEQPYTEYRRVSYDEVMAMNETQREARRSLILGTLALIGGIAATQSDSSISGLATYGGLVAGAYLIRDGIYTSDEAKLHIENLAELGNSLESEVTPKTIELEESTITLSGNVEAQYNQWREILADLYAAEIGDIEAASQQQ